MTQHVVCHGLNIDRRYEIATCQPGMRASTAIKSDRCTRARAVLQLPLEILTIALGLSRGEDDLNDVLLQRFGQVQIQHFLARCHYFPLREDVEWPKQRLIGDGSPGLISVEFEYRPLAIGVWITHHHMQQKPVELRLG